MSSLKLVEAEPVSASESPQKYDYSALSANVAGAAREAAARIKVRLKRTAEDIIEIGRDLKATKDSLPHGQWLPWLKAETPFSDSMARQYMQIAREFGSNQYPGTDLDGLGFKVLRSLSSAPDSVREEVEQRLAKGELFTLAQIKQLKSAFEEREKKLREEADKELQSATDKAQHALVASGKWVPVETHQEAADRAKQLEAELALKFERDGSVIDRHVDAAVRELEARILELSEANAAGASEVRRLSDELTRINGLQAAEAVRVGGRADNIIRPDFSRHLDDAPEDLVGDPLTGEDAMGSFCGALLPMRGLEFDPKQFWARAERGSLYCKQLYDAALEVNEKLGILIREYNK